MEKFKEIKWIFVGGGVPSLKMYVPVSQRELPNFSLRIFCSSLDVDAFLSEKRQLFQCGADGIFN